MKTTVDLINDATRLVMLPVTTALGTLNTDILAMANQELSSRIIPLVSSVNEEYMVQTIDIPVTAGQAQYRMPSRSVGAKLRDVRWLQGATPYPLPRIEVEQLDAFTITAQGIPAGFWLAAGSINLVPIPVQGVLRIRYYTAPRKLVEWNGSTTSANIGVIGSVTNYTTVNRTDDSIIFAPSNVSFTTPLNKQIDIISSRTPYEFLAVDATITATGPARATVPTAVTVGRTPNLSPSIQPGDVLASGDTSPIIQLPDEVYPLLVNRVSIQLAIQLGDFEKSSALSKIYDEQERSFLKLFSPRIDGSPKKMQGLYQSSGMSNRFWRLR